MKVQISKSTTINSVDFSNLSFGEIFTDHMFECDFENGKWKEPKIIPYQPIKMDPSTSVFHYGQAIFEGLKAYKDKNGQVWLFRPEENLNRLNKSAIRLSIPEFPKSFFLEGLKKLLTIDTVSYTHLTLPTKRIV